MSYIYVRKDLTYLKNPASQTLLKAFLKALYSDDYIPVCEEEFGFNRVSGDLRDKALAAIDALIVSDGAPEWAFENDETSETGQNDYVISMKRNTYSALADKSASDAIASLKQELEELYENLITLELEMAETGGSDGGKGSNEDRINTALGLAAASFALCMLTIVVVVVKFVLKP